jgi:hypothetical protein
MLIRSTPYTCFVMLKNGLTLELVFGESVTEPTFATDALRSLSPNTPKTTRTQGVWMFHEEVLFDVEVGQA